MKLLKKLRLAFIALPLAFSAVSITPMLAQAQSQPKSQQVTAQEIANHFASIKTMTGDFIQIGPKGEMTEGTFYMERPGQIRFTYKGSDIRVIADGKSVVIHNKKLDTWDLYQLNQTPMKLLLDNQIDLSGGKLLAFSTNDKVAVMEIADKTMGGGKLKLIFDPKTYELRQWTMIDRQNQETTVQITELKTGVRFADGMFKIDYQRISMKRNRN
ncbi:outer membrane lipoprotein carrier protein LolA [Bartonella sp. HY406]|nr:outer membrane lipoprotein carrier protein LolA [Bartonella sp. HY406]UXN02874.1 outer membrane lipoprotein carrier protein LolA [Bartonella sp. HY406]